MAPPTCALAAAIDIPLDQFAWTNQMTAFKAIIYNKLRTKKLKYTPNINISQIVIDFVWFCQFRCVLNLFSCKNIEEWYPFQ